MIRVLQIVAIVLSAIFVVAAVGFVLIEKTWVGKEPNTPEGYFLYGSTGTELMPLPVFQVLPDIFPDQFQPAGKQAGDWIDQFGFVRGKEGVNEGLPLGINVSFYRPKSGAPSPVPFVGFNCAACHTAQIRRSPGDQGLTVYAMGNPTIDLVAFGEAIKTSLLDEQRLTPDIIASTYEAKYHKSLGLIDKLMITLWLSGARTQIRADLPLRDWPRSGPELRDPTVLPSGPGRNQPMEETVRFLIDRTPFPAGGSSEIPSLYHQERRDWAQYDGSVRDPLTRNSLAALGVGASVDNLRVPGILHTLQQSYQYLIGLDGPKYSDVFPGQKIDATRAQRGREVYLNYCGDCHGWPGKPGEWVKGKRQGEIVPPQEIGTDNARVSFRYYDQSAQLIYDFFPVGHPLKPKREDVRAGHGFINSPLESPFSRAPYLHNGSVATLAELINLKPRRTVLYRGANLFDPADVGLLIPDTPDVKTYFRYDTTVYGNSNRGHDYPRPYRAKGWNEDELTDLLEYLKTL
jgi:hypothetical protein